MLIRKVMYLLTEEKETLMETGKILASIRDSKADYDMITDDTMDLLKALQNTLTECLSTETKVGK